MENLWKTFLSAGKGESRRRRSAGIGGAERFSVARRWRGIISTVVETAFYLVTISTFVDDAERFSVAVARRESVFRA